MSIINLYFYIWSKGNFVSCRGWILSGVFGFFLPLLFTLSLINLFLKKYHIPILDNTIAFWSILSILLISIYFYYRHNGRGEKVIDYYEKSKYNKWYNLLLLHIESTEKVQFFKDQNEKCLRFITFLSTNRLNKAMIGRKRMVKRLFFRY